MAGIFLLRLTLQLTKRGNTEMDVCEVRDVRGEECEMRGSLRSTGTVTGDVGEWW